MQTETMPDFKNARRPELKPFDDTKDELKFMQLDIDFYYTEGCLFPKYLEANRAIEHSLLRVFGVTKEGWSVLTHLHNFHSYLWVELQRINLLPKPGQYKYEGLAQIDEDDILMPKT